MDAFSSLAQMQRSLHALVERIVTFTQLGESRKDFKGR